MVYNSEGSFHHYGVKCVEDHVTVKLVSKAGSQATWGLQCGPGFEITGVWSLLF